MLFKRYKYLELEKTDIGNDEHNYYETVWYIRAYNNKRAYDNRNNTETSKSLDSNGKKKEKKKSRIIVKIIRDSYGNVTRVFVEPKAKKKKKLSIWQQRHISHCLQWNDGQQKSNDIYCRILKLCNENVFKYQIQEMIPMVIHLW